MLTIRDAQMEMFRLAAEARFPVELARFLRETQPERTHALSDEVLRDRTGHAIASARRFGLERSNAIAFFAGLSLAVGPRFHEHPAVLSVLTDPSLSPEERLGKLTERLTSWDWLAAQDNGDVAWRSALASAAGPRS